jgi:glycosyltransferase involved in cell wall biosynthesis
LRANSTAEYVAAIGQLFDDADLRATLAQRGRELIESTFTWNRAGEAYERVITAR